MFVFSSEQHTPPHCGGEPGGHRCPCSAWNGARVKLQQPQVTISSSVQEGPLQMACVGYALKVQNNNLLFFNIQIQILFFLLFLQRYSFV